METIDLDVQNCDEEGLRRWRRRKRQLKHLLPKTLPRTKRSRARRCGSGCDADDAAEADDEMKTPPKQRATQKMTASNRLLMKTTAKNPPSAQATSTSLQDPRSCQSSPNPVGSGRQRRARQQRRGSDHLSVAGGRYCVLMPNTRVAAAFPARSPTLPTARNSRKSPTRSTCHRVLG